MGESGRRAVLFLGPSTPSEAEARRRLRRFELRPPVKRGDVAELVARRGPGTIVIADGLFYHSFAVDHRELLTAVEAGWRVIGMASMGALRAAEMHRHGVEGYGAVYDLVRDPGLDDDELMCLHEPEPPYRVATLPLVEVRAALGVLVDDGRWPRRTALSVLEGLRSMWFGERRWGAVTGLIAQVGGSRELADVLASELGGHRRIKNHDVERFLAGLPAPEARMDRDGLVHRTESTR